MTIQAIFVKINGNAFYHFSLPGSIGICTNNQQIRGSVPVVSYHPSPSLSLPLFIFAALILLLHRSTWFSLSPPWIHLIFSFSSTDPPDHIFVAFPPLLQLQLVRLPHLGSVFTTAHTLHSDSHHDDKAHQKVEHCAWVQLGGKPGQFQQQQVRNHIVLLCPSSSGPVFPRCY